MPGCAVEHRSVCKVRANEPCAEQAQLAAQCAYRAKRRAEHLAGAGNVANATGPALRPNS
eukprot:6348646-Lingulodinium_polyedra.AAC.1